MHQVAWLSTKVSSQGRSARATKEGMLFGTLIVPCLSVSMSPTMQPQRKVSHCWSSMGGLLPNCKPSIIACFYLLALLWHQLWHLFA